MRTWKRIVGAGALLTGVVAMSAGTIDAGQPLQPIGTLTIDVEIYGPAADDIDTSWLPEVFVGGTDEYLVHCNAVDGADDALWAGRLHECDFFQTTTFTLGFPTAPSPYSVDFTCEDQSVILNEAFTDPSATYTIDGLVNDVSCSIVMSTGMIFVDKLFPSEMDGPAIVGPDPDGGANRDDFTIEAYTSGGTLVTSGVDDSDDGCGGFGDVAAGNCLMFLVAPGDYVLGETSVPGYLAVDVDCGDVGSPGLDGPPQINPPQLEMLDAPGAAFNVTDEFPGASVYCTLVNQYFEGSVILTKDLTNDDGGTAVLGDFTLELYDGDGGLVDSGVCGNDGVCLEGDYPIGDYVVGEVGPDGYTRTVTQQIALPTEQLTDTEASFTLEAFAQVEVNVASDDQATTTTVAPTTVGPTTTDLGAGVATLPATGSSDNTSTLAAMAVALLLLGLGATTLARRRT